MVKLQSVNKKQPTQKIVNGGRKTADEVVNKTDPLLDWRRGIALLAGEEQRLLLLADPKLLQQVDVLGGDLGSFPLSAPQIRCRHLRLGGAVPSEPRARWHQQWRRRKVRAWLSSRSDGRNGGFSQRKAEVRRERKCERRKTMTLSRGAVNRCTVGWRNCEMDDVHVDKG